MICSSTAESMLTSFSVHLAEAEIHQQTFSNWTFLSVFFFTSLLNTNQALSWHTLSRSAHTSISWQSILLLLFCCLFLLFCEFWFNASQPGEMWAFSEKRVCTAKYIKNKNKNKVKLNYVNKPKSSRNL